MSQKVSISGTAGTSEALSTNQKQLPLSACAPSAQVWVASMLHQTKAPSEMLHCYLPVSLFDLLFCKLSKKSNMLHSIISLFCVCAITVCWLWSDSWTFFLSWQRNSTEWRQEFVFKYMCTLTLCCTLQCGQCAFVRHRQNVETSLLLLMGFCWSWEWWNRFKLSSFLSNQLCSYFKAPVSKWMIWDPQLYFNGH